MPTPAMTEAIMREAWQAFEEHGNVTKAAKELGLHRNTYHNRLQKAREAGLHLSQGAQETMQAAMLNGMEIKGGYKYVLDENGNKLETVRWSAPDTTPEDIIDKFTNAFEGIKPAKRVTPPKQVMEELATVYPLMDVHLGMLAWGKETGAGDYDLNIACADMMYAFEKVTAITPDSKEAILIVGGDFFHADDENNQTPQSKHNLDVDGRHFKVLDTGIQLVATVIKSLLKKHETLTIKVLRGNHDLHAHMVLTFALFERYREEHRIVVDKDAMDLFMFHWGKCLISAHHGDRAKPDRLTMYLSDVCPFWSETRHRFMFTGHVHHDASKDLGPLKWESLRAFCPPDSYAAGMKFASRRALQAITFHKTDGLILRAIDPIERLAA